MDAKNATSPSRSSACGFGRRVCRSGSKGKPASARRPLARRVLTPVEVERVVTHLARLGPVLGQELFCVRGRRHPRSRRHVPEQDERPAGPQDAGDLSEGARASEDVEGLRGEDGVHGGVAERNLLGARGERFGLRAEPDEQAAHRLGRLDCADAVEGADE